MTALTIESVLDSYRSGRATAEATIGALLDRLDASRSGNAWIHRLPRNEVMAYVARLRGKSADDLPLYGVPFAIKDNIDLAGAPTTAGCPEFAYVPTRSAFVVDRLIAAGAIPIGKTNLDQFATGLVGTRSPFGACENSFDARYISGGSSSGSAVAVARGFVSFALGTDTAGSGRVPAAFNNIVGLKPSGGTLSTSGVVPACRSLDCVSIFALCAGDAQRVLDIAHGFDASDAYSRRLPERGLPRALRLGTPRRDQLEFYGDGEYAKLFELACGQATSIGWTVVEIDFEPFFETARLLYEGPWVAERFAAIEEFLTKHPEALYPVTASIIGAGARATAVAAFRAQYRLKALQRATASAWENVDALLVPSAGTIYRIADVLADPVRLNSNLGRYTNFVNLLDLAAIAVPAGFRSDGLPFGVTLIAQAGSDRALAHAGARLHAAGSSRLGIANDAVPTPVEPVPASGHVHVAVCGAHMSGLPLNHQLTQREGYLVRATRTAPRYRFYALPGGPPLRPGLIRTKEGGAAIDVEVWAVPEEHFGTFVAGIPSPLGIGKVALEDGTLCSGFVCETWAVDGAEDITSFGGWRAYLDARFRQETSTGDTGLLGTR